MYNHIRIRSRIDGLPLSVLETVPEKEPWCLMQILHGMCEHKERYLPLMRYMAARGVICAIHDHRGHGKSMRDKDDKGYTYGGGARAMVEDARLVTAYLRGKWGEDLPLVMLGHSMGSLVLRAFLRKYDYLADAAILSGSPSRQPGLKAGQIIAWTEDKLLGGHYKSWLLKMLCFAKWEAKFSRQGACGWICSDPAVVRKYRESELCGFPFTADGYRTLFGLMEQAYADKGWNCRNPGLPILFISGGDDPCMGNVRKFKYALDHMRIQGYYDVKGKIYPGLRHEILNEYEKEKIYRNCYCFIRKKLV